MIEAELGMGMPLIEGLDLTRPSVIIFNIQFVARRLILVLIALFFDDYPWLQILIFLGLS